MTAARTSRVPDRPPHLPPGVYRARSARTGTLFYYGDFRRYADVGGRREPLRRPGEQFATTDPFEAARLYVDRVEKYERARHHGGPLPGEKDPRLGPMMVLHLRQKRQAGAHKLGTLKADRSALARVLARLGNVPLSTITPARLQQYVAKRLLEKGTRRATRVAARTVRNELHALSNMFKRAIALGLASANPVTRLPDKPTVPDAEAAYLSTVEAAQLLDAAARIDSETASAREELARTRHERRQETRRRRKKAEDDGGPSRRARIARLVGTSRRCPFIEAVLSTMLYTGGRQDEILGLTVADVHFERGLVFFRRNTHRDLKRARHRRAVPLLPPLATVLRHHIARAGLSGKPSDTLLFPSRAGKKMHDFASPFTRCLKAAGIDTDRRATRHTLRHTYASKLLRTTVRTESGERALRSSISVAKALGHKSAAMIDAVYGHDLYDEGYSDELTYESQRRLPASRLPD